jgi:hypothetical protein
MHNNSAGDTHWDYLRMGYKSSQTTNYIYTSQLTGVVDKVVIKVNAYLKSSKPNGTLDSCKLYTSTDGENWTEAATFEGAKATADMAVYSVSLGDKAAAGLYYKVEFVTTCTSTTNGVLQLHEVLLVDEA